VSRQSQLTTVGLLFAGLVVSPSYAAAPAFTIPAKFRPDYALLIEVRVNGSHPLLCQFDSGGSTTFALDRVKAKTLGLQPTTTGRSAGVGPAAIDDERLPGVTLDLGTLQIPNQTIVMFPIDAESCIFGTGILKDFAVQIDYGRAVIHLYKPETFKPPRGAVDVPFTLSAGSPVVDAVISFGSNRTAHASILVDTAVRRFLALSKGFVDSQGVISSNKVVQPQFGAARGTGGEVGLLVTRLGAIRIGAVQELRPVALLLRTASGASRKEPDGYLGNEFFYRFLVTLDYPHMRLLLKPNQHYHAAPTPYDGSGLSMERRGTKIVVIAIEPASAASHAGIEVGDELLSLDGEPASELTGLRVQEMLCRLSGTSVVRIRRSDQMRNYVLHLKPVL
jgi:hypothetical protein